ncbi:hypothetical protein JAAARDRAFT_28079 [Jaapia argillacea MUCL 33604]|uniref:Uncharacterized protein n=1 Tax=Jaapia argillacea MUCL 33604 TaxID=933084 RepID=A0A067QBZ1_9AGAM|nr:hypothetical protein JAAARDRAFT_28079 [Jaapia argillacea MUCL 33604]
MPHPPVYCVMVPLTDHPCPINKLAQKVHPSTAHASNALLPPNDLDHDLEDGAMHPPLPLPLPPP